MKPGDTLPRAWGGTGPGRTDSPVPDMNEIAEALELAGVIAEKQVIPRRAGRCGKSQIVVQDVPPFRKLRTARGKLPRPGGSGQGRSRLNRLNKPAGDALDFNLQSSSPFSHEGPLHRDGNLHAGVVQPAKQSPDGTG